MRGLVVRWLVSAIALYLTSLIVRGIEIQSLAALVFAAVTIGVLNAVVRPLILLLTLPLNILTLGFNVHGFWSALGGWLLMSFFTFVINVLIGETGRIEIVHVRQVVRF